MPTRQQHTFLPVFRVKPRGPLALKGQKNGSKLSWLGEKMRGHSHSSSSDEEALIVSAWPLTIR